MKKVIFGSAFLILVLIVAQNVSGHWKTRHWDAAPICGNEFKRHWDTGWDVAPHCGNGFQRFNKER